MRYNMTGGLAALFGSESRAWVLGVLANAARPLTGYRIAQVSGCQRIKVNSELRNLEAIGLAKSLRTEDGRMGWVLVEPNLAAFLRQRIRIAWSEDMRVGFSDQAKRTRAIRRQVKAGPGIDLSRYAGWEPQDVSRYRRPPEKDLLLRRLGLRPSARNRAEA